MEEAIKMVNGLDLGFLQGGGIYGTSMRVEASLFKSNKQVLEGKKSIWYGLVERVGEESKIK